MLIRLNFLILKVEFGDDPLNGHYPLMIYNFDILTLINQLQPGIAYSKTSENP